MDVEAFLGTACELLSVPSTVDRPAELHRALALVLDFVGEGFAVRRFESDGRPSALLYRGDPQPEFRVILNGHLDVVPAPPEQFQPRLVGDRLYARGALDMKVSALVLAQVFKELAPSLPYPVALQLVTDEEIGGRHGTLHQLQQGVTGRFAIVGEQTGMQLVTESRGRAQARLQAVGRTGHGAYPWLADNALHTLTRTIDALLSAYPVPAAEVWSATINVARIETTNRSFNLVPADALAWLDIRFPPEDAQFNNASTEAIAAHLQAFCEPGVTATVDSVDPPHYADRDNPDVRLLQRAAQAQGYAAGFLRKHGAADGRFYYQRGIDAVIFGVGGDGQHSADEHVDIGTIEPYYRALRHFLAAVAPAGGSLQPSGQS